VVRHADGVPRQAGVLARVARAHVPQPQHLHLLLRAVQARRLQGAHYVTTDIRVLLLCINIYSHVILL